MEAVEKETEMIKTWLETNHKDTQARPTHPHGLAWAPVGSPERA